MRPFLASYLQLLCLVVALPFLLILYPLLKCCVLARWRKKKLKEPKVIVITGASAGIGAAFAKHYSKPGIVLGLTGRNQERLNQVTKECEAKGATVFEGILDVTNREGMEKFLHELDDKHPVDLVIANAGVTSMTLNLAGDLAAATRSVYGTNLDGTFNTILPLLDRMRKRGSGQIALMSSISGLGPVRGMFEYSSSKSALMVYAEALRWLVYRDGVHVNALVPGFFDSDMTKKNTDPMPFKMTQDDALKFMVEGLARDDPVITTPWSFATMAWLLLRVLPHDARDTIAKTGLSRLVAYHGKRQNKHLEGKKSPDVAKKTE